MTKRILAVLMAAAMVFCFAACGEKSTKSDSELYIGGIGPTTGDYANYGLSVKYGAEIAVEEINADGGINGMKIVFNMQDSQGDPEAAVSAYGALIDWGMDISIGTTLSGEMASVSTESADDDMFMISPSASADNCLKGSENAFRICFADSYQGIASANYIAKHFSGKKIGVFYDSGIDYSSGLYESFKSEAEKLGINIVEVQSYDSNSKETDYSTQIKNLQRSGAEVIFIPIYAADAASFLSQAKNGTESAIFDSNVYFFGCDGLDGILTKVDKNPSVANNVLMLTPFSESSTDEDVVEFVAAYKEKAGKVPDQFAADAYDAVYVIKEAIEKAGITKASDIKGSAISKVMTSLSYDGITGSMTWTADGNTNKEAIAVIYRDGVGSVFGE